MLKTRILWGDIRPQYFCIFIVKSVKFKIFFDKFGSLIFLNISLLNLLGHGSRIWPVIRRNFRWHHRSFERAELSVAQVGKFILYILIKISFKDFITGFLGVADLPVQGGVSGEFSHCKLLLTPPVIGFSLPQQLDSKYSLPYILKRYYVKPFHIAGHLQGRFLI